MFGFFKQTYSIKKDAKPEDTLKRLRAIFNDLDINLVESEFFNYNKDKSAPCSLSLSIANSNTLATNGKGKTPLTALCSAYSEMIERLSNCAMGLFKLNNDFFCYSPDEVFFEIEELSYEKLSYIRKFFSQDLSEDQIKNLLYYLAKNQKKMKGTNTDIGLYYLPFYDVLNDSIVDLPLHLLLWKNYSNGMCAGNTKQEALVQGLSEVFERYAKREVILNEYALPNIPEKYYRKFREIDRILKYLEKNGIKVIVKDASIGKSLPVVMTIFIDKKLNKFSFQFAGHPDYPIAIERTLTEFLQGVDITDVKMRNFLFKFALIDTVERHIYSEIILTLGQNSYFDTSHPLSQALLKNDSKFQLNKKYFKRNLKKNNDELLKELVLSVKSLSTNLFVRDMSYLGFDAFIIDVPGLSEIQMRTDDTVYTSYCFSKLKRYIFNEIDEISADEIIAAVNFPYSIHYYVSGYFLYSVPNAFLAAIAYLEKGNKEKTIEILDYMSARDEVFRKYLPIVRNLSSVLKGNIQLNDIEDEHVKNKVNEYLTSPLQTLFNFIDEIKEIYNFNSFRSDLSNKISTINKTIAEKYIANTPNQENLREFFKEILSQD